MAVPPLAEQFMSSDLVRIDHRHHFVGDTHFGHVGILDMAMRLFRISALTTVTSSISGTRWCAMTTTFGT